MDVKQLFEKASKGYIPIYPLASMESIIDENQSINLIDILAKYNHIYVTYKDTQFETRRQIPEVLRKYGLWISYEKDNTLYTEFYKGTNVNAKEDKYWVDDNNWEMVPNLKFIQDASSRIPNGVILPEHLSDSLKQLLSEKHTIVNMVDDEDLESKDCGIIKFKDRKYNPDLSSGKGYKILRKNWITSRNILTQDMINEPNTVYEIRYDFDLNNTTININDNCTLKFNGGSLENGTINLKNTNIDALCNISIFKNVNIIGNTNSVAYADWFGAKGYTFPNKIDVSQEIQRALDSSFNIIKFNIGYYYIKNTITLSKLKTIELLGSLNLPIRSNILDYYTEEANNTVIWSDCDIDIFIVKFDEIAYRKGRNKIYINGGNIDVSMCEDFTHNVLTFYLPKNGGYQPNITTNIIGPDGRTGSIITKSCTGKGIVFYRNSETDKGNMYGGKISSTISRLHTGISNETNDNVNPTAVTAFIIDCLINCKYAINFGALGIPGSEVSGEIQPENYFNEDNNEKIILGNLRNVTFSCFFWDLGAPSATVNQKHNRYAFEVRENEVPIVTGCSILALYTGCIVDSYKLLNLSFPKLIIKTEDDLKSIALSNNVSDIGLSCYLKYNRNTVTWDGRNWVTADGRNLAKTYGTERPVFDKFTNHGYIFLDRSIVRSKPIFWNGITWIDAFGYEVNSNYGATSERPIVHSGNAGFEYYDTSLQKPIFWNGTTWIDSDGFIANRKYGTTAERNTYLKDSQLGYLFYDKDLDSYMYYTSKGEWAFLDGNVITNKKFGVFAEKPSASNVTIGYAYFCTDKQTAEGASNGIIIYYKGNNVWVDALGRVVDNNYPIATQGTTAQRPTDIQIGFQYYDTTLKKYIVWNGTEWVDNNGYSANYITKGITSERPTLTNADDGFEYYDTILKKKILWNGIAWVNIDGTTL